MKKKHDIVLVILIFSFLLNILSVMGQKQKRTCICVDNPNYNSIINCDTIFLHERIRLYRQFNCDSSWLTLEKEGKYLKVLNVYNKNLIEMTPRLGYQFVREYSNSILFMNRQVSGGGIPMNYDLICKENGEVIKKFGSVIYYSDSLTSEIVVVLHKDTIPTLKFYNIKTGTETCYSIFKEKNDISEFMNNDIYPENHLINPSYYNKVFSIDYVYKKTNSSKEWGVAKIVIDDTSLSRECK